MQRVLDLSKGRVHFIMKLHPDGYKDIWYIPYLQMFNPSNGKFFIIESEYTSSITHKELTLNSDVLRINSSGELTMH